MRHFLLILTCGLALLAADEREINALIDAVVKATPETRYEKMNAFKLKMRELNAQQRAEALTALRNKAYPALEPSALPSQSFQRAPAKGMAEESVGQQQMRMQQQQMQFQREVVQPGFGSEPQQPQQPQTQPQQPQTQPQQPMPQSIQQKGR